MRVLEYRGLGGFAVVYVNPSFVVVNVRRGVNVVLPNRHRDNREKFSAMLLKHEQADNFRTYATLGAARRVADLARAILVDGRSMLAARTRRRRA